MAADIFAELNQALGNDTILPSTSQIEPLVSSAISHGRSAPSFPEIPADFNSPAPAIAADVSAALPPSNMDRSERLEKLVDDALVKTQELLDIQLDPMDENFVKVASMQKDLAVALINTGVKVDENRFKKRQSDALTGILAQLIDREKALKPLIDLTPVGHG